MTIDQAKEILSRPFDMENVPQEVLEAHRMAIEALEQEQVIEAFAKCPLVYPITKNDLMKLMVESHHEESRDKEV